MNTDEPRMPYKWGQRNPRKRNNHVDVTTRKTYDNICCEYHCSLHYSSNKKSTEYVTAVSTERGKENYNKASNRKHRKRTKYSVKRDLKHLVFEMNDHLPDKEYNSVITRCNGDNCPIEPHLCSSTSIAFFVPLFESNDKLLTPSSSNERFRGSANDVITRSTCENISGCRYVTNLCSLIFPVSWKKSKAANRRRNRVLSDCSIDSEEGCNFIVFDNTDGDDDAPCKDFGLRVEECNDPTVTSNSNLFQLSGCLHSLSLIDPFLTVYSNESERCQRTLLPAKSQRKKVRFVEDKKLETVHLIIAWSYAYRSARSGPWEVFARDTSRFKIKIQSLDRIISPILDKNHRQKIWQTRMLTATVKDN